MARMRTYYVYILASKAGTLYVGVTNDIARRVAQHRSGEGSAFARRYHVSDLVYVEVTGDARSALTREKQIKSWRRSKKLALIANANPRWDDLAAEWD